MILVIDVWSDSLTLKSGDLCKIDITASVTYAMDILLVDKVT